MEPTDPRRRSNAKVWRALALTVLPGLLAAIGSEYAVGLALWTWPFASLFAGALLGRHTGKPDGSDVLHAIGWSIACGIFSFGLQLVGCSIVGYEPNFH
jgi:hypothetical protein